MIQPPTELAKRFLVVFENAKDAAFMYDLAGHDPIEIYEAEHYFNTTTLPAVMSKPWKKLIEVRLERRLRWLENARSDVWKQYSALGTFKARKAYYEQKTPVLDGLVEATKQKLKMEPHIWWTPAEVMALKLHGVERYLSYYVDRFFPSAKVVQ